MNRRTVLNASLLTLILVLVYYLAATGPQDPSQGHVVVADVDPESIQRIHLSREGMPDMEFIRSMSGWQIIKPVDTPANPDRIKTILNLPNSRSRAQLDSGLTDIREFGLDSPSVILALDNEVFHFGDINPFDNSRYVRHENTIHVTGDNLYPLLLQPAEFFAGNRGPEDEVLLKESREYAPDAVRAGKDRPAAQ